jgi:hypothetical protein
MQHYSSDFGNRENNGVDRNIWVAGREPATFFRETKNEIQIYITRRRPKSGSLFEKFLQ